MQVIHARTHTPAYAHSTLINHKYEHKHTRKHTFTCAHARAEAHTQGTVLTWGKNDDGQLGHGHGDDMFEPTIVTELETSRVMQIACGEEHMMALTPEGIVSPHTPPTMY